MCGRIYGVLGHPYHEEPRHRPVGDKNVMAERSFYMQQHSLIMNIDDKLVEEYGETHWRVKTHRLLHQHWFILTLAFLMVLDIIFMVVDLVLAAFYPHCSVVDSACECTFDNASTGGHDPIKDVVSSPSSSDDVCLQHCIEPPVVISNTTLALTIASIVILTLFLLELLVNLIVLGLKRFFGNVFLTLDLLIVCVSIGLEIYLLLEEVNKNHDEDPAVQAATVPLIIFARSWRLLRIGHGAYKEAHDFYGEKIRKLEDRISELEKDYLSRAHSHGGKTGKNDGIEDNNVELPANAAASAIVKKHMGNDSLTLE